mmetsp:Transcript_8352/g.23944  ORF Transcript_8352/g.23944 Transcript_8352/m.23944 type:complete len:630 (-) Transcript_8352:168-2057(-)
MGNQFLEDSSEENTESDEEFQHAAPVVAAVSQRKPAALAEEDDSDEDTDLDDDGLLIQRAQMELSNEYNRTMAEPEDAPKPPSPKLPAKSAPAKRPRATRPGGGVTLKRLIDEGFLEPGVGNLRCEYKGMISIGDLREDGRISWEGQLFESPSAWSIHLKRLITPNRKADDGWKTIKYEGKYLEHYKMALAAHQTVGSDLSTQDAASMAGKALAGSKRPKLGSEDPGPSVVAPASPGPGSAKTPGAVTDKLLPAKRKEPPPQKPSQRPQGAPPKPAGPQVDPNGSGAPSSNPTAYASNRPRREQVKQPDRLMPFPIASALGDDHQMVPCEPFKGEPGQGTKDCQPFAIEIAPSAQLLMDLHAHLDTSEIIGLLAGHYNKTTRKMHVVQAYPVKEVATEDDSVNVEMDPEDQLTVCSLIKKRNMQCIGWYHSHPTFPAIPSVVDIENQARYQEMNRDPETGEEPYIAAIVAPYMKDLKAGVSSIAWFYVTHPTGRHLEYGEQLLEQGYVPRELEVRLDSACDKLDENLMSDVKEVVKRYSVKYQSRVEMYNAWKDSITNLDKLKCSLESRVPESWRPESRKAYVHNIVTMVREAWYSNNMSESETESGQNGAVAGQPTRDDGDTESLETQ